MKKILYVSFVIILVVMIFSVSIFLKNNEENNDEKLSIITTMFPLYDFAKIIGGEKVNVSMLLTPGVDAHSYEAKASDISKIMNSDLFIYMGDFMEIWVKNLIYGIKINETKILVAGEFDNLKYLLADHEHSHGDIDFEHAQENDHKQKASKNDDEHDEHNDTSHDDNHDEHDEHNDTSHDEHNDASHDEYKNYFEISNLKTSVDPHIWMDFENSQHIAKNIYESLANIDPENKQYYEENLNLLITKLNNLDKKYFDFLENCENRNLIFGGHFAFNYWAKRYNLNYFAAQGFSPDAEPSAKDLIKLIELINNEGVSAIFFEEMYSPKIAETLSTETKLEMYILNGAHNLSKNDLDLNKSFVSIMEENLKNLVKGLKCE
jgi:zinc transport system substrate-binding protein